VARTFPEKPAGSIKPEIARVFRALKRLPDDWNVWYHVTPWQPDAPHFLVLDGKGRALLLHVSGATPQQAQQSPQLQMLGLEVEKETPGEAEEHHLSTFIAEVSRKGIPPEAISSAVIFPNLTSKDLKLVQQYAAKDPEFRWLDRGWIDDRKLGAWKKLFGRKPLDDRALHVLRERFTPEVVIPAVLRGAAPTPPEDRRGTGYLPARLRPGGHPEDRPGSGRRGRDAVARFPHPGRQRRDRQRQDLDPAL